MEHTTKPTKPKRERHSAAWGKRLSMMLLLATGMAFGQRWTNPMAGETTGRFSSRIAPELSALLAKAHQGSAKGQTVKVIVQYKQVPSATHYATMQGRGARLHARLHMIKGAAFTIPVSALPALEADPEIASVTIDHPMHLMDDYADAASNVSAAVSAGFNGAGVGVAVIDSGINDSHPDLQDSTETTSRVVYHQDFTGTPTTNASGGHYDLYGHGTHVAGIVGGNGYLSAGRLVGVAPAVNLIDLRALDANGSGTDSSVIAAIQAAITLQNTYNIRVINLSLGRGIPVSYTQDPLCQAVEAAWNSGIVVVVAAGNYGRLSVNGSHGFGTITAPGNDPYVITVGAMKSMNTYTRLDDQKASYSSKGPTTYDHVVKPDIVAPRTRSAFVVGSGCDAGSRIPSGSGSRNRRQQRLLPPERHQHGDSGRQRRRGLAVAAEQRFDPRPGESASHEDRVQDGSPPLPSRGFRIFSRTLPSSMICSRSGRDIWTCRQLWRTRIWLRPRPVPLCRLRQSTTQRLER